MPNEVLQKNGTQIRFFVSGSFSPADDGTNWTRDGGHTPTDVDLTLASVADGVGAQSDKVDLGATRAARYRCFGCVDFTGEVPSAGATVDYYWMPSTSSTEGEGNVAGNSGIDATPAPSGQVPSGMSVGQFAAMGIYIGSLVCTDDGNVQNGYVGEFSPPTRWGQLLVVNQSGDSFEADDDEMHQILEPVIDEVQD